MSQSGKFLTKKKKSNFLRPPRRLGGLKTKRPPKGLLKAKIDRFVKKCNEKVSCNLFLPIIFLFIVHFGQANNFGRITLVFCVIKI